MGRHRQAARRSVVGRGLRRPRRARVRCWRKEHGAANPFAIWSLWMLERQQTAGRVIMYFKTNLPGWERAIRIAMGAGLMGPVDVVKTSRNTLARCVVDRVILNARRSLPARAAFHSQSTLRTCRKTAIPASAILGCYTRSCGDGSL